ncbi:MAG: glycosyltransferase [Candidatus Moranbacteria bacterium]|nr:glycosyltransferase [Candidatus Moranbacteria bacterium]
MGKIDILDLPFDQYSRNYIISAGIKKYKKANKLPGIKILDVGGRAGMLEHFIDPGDKLTLLDIRPGKEPNLVLGDGNKMNMFEDNSFDVVISSDVFEHINFKRRVSFIKESIRVSKGLIVLAAPFDSPEVKQAEKTAAAYFKKIAGERHLWLEEHIKNGLPSHKDLENLLDQEKLGYNCVFSNNTRDWLLFQLVIFYSHALKVEGKKLTRPLFRFYNQNFLELEEKTSSFYRRIYFITKRGEFKPSLEYSFSRGKYTRFIEKIFSLLFKLALDFKISEEDEIKKSKLLLRKNWLKTNNLAAQLEKKKSQLATKNYQLERLTAEMDLMRSSKFWKLRNRYLKLKNFRREDMSELQRKALSVAKREGIIKTVRYFFKYLAHGREYFQSGSHRKDDYREWINLKEKKDEKEISQKINELDYKPKISIITPVYNVDSKWLNQCVDSVVNQSYPHWELCLHDDASTKKETLNCLKKWKTCGDKRIRVSFGQNNQHISGASNEALKLATGEFILLLDNDDKLPENALYEYVKALNKNPKIDFIYSDEDKIDEKNRRLNPFFKPDWSPDMFLSMNYVCHSLFRRSIVNALGGFRKGYEGAQDYDLVLRFIERTSPEKIFHIPKILYHWRQIETSTSTGIAAKNYAGENSIKALNDYLKRNMVEGHAQEELSPGRFRIKRKIVGDPGVSIIIPFHDQTDVLIRCVESILTKTDYKNYEIVLVNNQSQEEKTRRYLEKLKDYPACKVLKYDKPFNFSTINNFAVSWSKNEYILFLNNDTEVITGEWLSAMLEQIQRPEVGAVGAKLLYPNNKIQHAGVILGTGIAGHAFKHLPEDNEGYMSQANIIKNYSAVTAACLLTKKSVFSKAGGFDEKNLSIAYNDIDLCLKIRKMGYLIVYTPYAKLYHYESLSRGDDEQLKTTHPEKYRRVKRERMHMFNKWRREIKNDPYYSPNLTRLKEDFSINLDAFPPRYV